VWNSQIDYHLGVEMSLRRLSGRVGPASASAAAVLSAFAACWPGAAPANTGALARLAHPARASLKSGLYRGHTSQRRPVKVWISRKPIIIGEKGNRREWTVDKGAPNVDFLFDVDVRGWATNPDGSSPHDTSGREQFAADAGHECLTSKASRRGFDIECSALLSGTGGESQEWTVVGHAAGNRIVGRFSYSHSWHTPDGPSGSLSASGRFSVRLVKRTGRQFVNPTGLSG
jgi:hypothetical protein